MKFKNIAIIAAVSLGISSTALASDGTINFTGEIIPVGCTVTSSTQNLSVPLGKAVVSEFRTAGTVIGDKSFDIVLTACPSSLTQAQVKFTGGTADATNPDLFGIATGAGNAAGIGIGIFESDGATLVKRGQNSRTVNISSTVDNTLTYYAKFVSTAATVTAGVVTASAEFNIVYP